MGFSVVTMLLIAVCAHYTGATGQFDTEIHSQFVDSTQSVPPARLKKAWANPDTACGLLL